MNAVARLKLTALGASLALAPGVAHAGAFLIYEQGTAALGRAGAFVGQADDPTAVYYNAAGLAMHPRLGVALGATAIVGSTTAKLGTNTFDAATAVNVPPTLYVSVPFASRFAAGLGVFVPYGLSMDWPATWPGRYRVTQAKAKSAAVNPSFAVRIVPRVSVGAGVSVTRATFELARDLNLVQANGRARLGGTDTGVGWNAGVLVEAIPHRLFAGASFRSASDLNVTGRADFTVPPEWNSTFADQDARAAVKTPHVAAVGGWWHATSLVSINLDVVWATWSRFQSLDFKFTDPKLDTTEPQNWHDTVSVRLGGEMALDAWRVRGGLGYEPSPVPASTLSPLVPDGDRALVAGGVARDLGPVRLELAYMATIIAARASKLEGFAATYDSVGQFVGATVQYRK